MHVRFSIIEEARARAAPQVYDYEHKQSSLHCVWHVKLNKRTNNKTNINYYNINGYDAPFLFFHYSFLLSCVFASFLSAIRVVYIGNCRPK